MLEAFKNFVQQEKLFIPGEQILLAVSGGIDSVVMCELFHQAGYAFGIAHCHFSLRGKEADEDEAFVRSLAIKYQVPFFNKRFQTIAFAKETGLSIQMAARKLRYEWFEEIYCEKKFVAVATAHHKNDAIETLLINLVRGTGISGLHGILPKRDNIIRPLLFATRNEIDQFVQKNHIPFREDSSNGSIKYMRNKIRSQVIPLLKEINPNLEETMSTAIERIREVERIYKADVQRKKEEVMSFEKEKILISIEKLKKLDHVKTYLFEFLQEYRFQSDIIPAIIEAFDAPSGKQFFSATHRLLKDRVCFIITEIRNSNNVFEAKIQKEDTSFSGKYIQLEIKKLDPPVNFSIPSSSKIACVDYDLLEFPMKLRFWKEGDVFKPLGMRMHKKVSDFLIDNKVSIADKEKVLVLTSDEKIVWVIGYRVDDRFKITTDTKRIYILKSC